MNAKQNQIPEVSQKFKSIMQDLLDRKLNNTQTFNDLLVAGSRYNEQVYSINKRNSKTAKERLNKALAKVEEEC